MSARGALLVLCLLGLGAPAQAQSWRAYTSDNFVVYTDLAESRTRDMIEDLELFRAVVMMFTEIEPVGENRRLRVIVFNKNGEFSDFSGGASIAGYYTQTAAGPRMVMGTGSSRQSTRAILFHEYVHHLLGEYSDLQYPRWYNEGLAEVLGATELRRGSVIVGAVNEGREATLLALEPLGIETLIQPGGYGRGGTFTSRFYATAWLFTHYLQIGAFTGDAELKSQTRDYLLRYAGGEDPVDAFEASFGMRPESMNARLRQYRSQRSVPVVSFRRPQVEVDIDVRRLDANERAFILGDLAWRTYGDALSLEYLSTVSTDDATAARALSLRAVIENHQERIELGERLAERALELDGDDSIVLGNRSHLAWDRYMRLHDAGDDGSGELTDVIEYGLLAVDADAENLEAHRFLWQAYAAQGDPVNAARSMVAAYQLDPSSLPLNMEMGVYLVNEGKPELARQFLEYVVNWAHDTDARAEAERLLGEMDSGTVPADP